MPCATKALVPQLLSLRSRALEVQLSPHAATTEACAVQEEKPPQWEACEPVKSSPPPATTRPSLHSNEDPAQPEINKKKSWNYMNLNIMSLSSGSSSLLEPISNEGRVKLSSTREQHGDNGEVRQVNSRQSHLRMGGFGRKALQSPACF